MGLAKIASIQMAGNTNGALRGGSTGELGHICSALVPYRELRESLPYLCTHMLSDITFSVNVLTCFMEAPLHVHWIAATRLLR